MSKLRLANRTIGFLFLITLILVLTGIEVKSSAGTSPPPDKTVWSSIDKLVGEQKYQEALQGTEQILKAARQAGHEDEWTRALIKAFANIFSRSNPPHSRIALTISRASSANSRDNSTC